MPAKVNPDDYDDYDEEEYFDDYDDAADDWEAEAAEEEEKEKAEAAMKAALAERKTQTRAPAAGQAKAEEDEGPSRPEDVAREIDRMRQEASDTAAGGELVSGAESVELLADAPTETAEDMTKLGERIAEHLLSFAGDSNFDAALTAFYESLGKEFKSLQAVNQNIARAEKMLGLSKKPRASRKKAGAKADNQQSMGPGNDVLNMDLEDRGGAHVEDGDAFF